MCLQPLDLSNPTESFLKNRIQNSLFLNAIMEEEIVKLTKSFDCLKASGPYSLPSQIMRILPNQIASILKTIINMPTDRKISETVEKCKGFTSI